jgi:hypothetical protein
MDRIDFWFLVALVMWGVMETRITRHAVSEQRRQMDSVRKSLQEQQSALSSIEVWVKPEEAQRTPFKTSSKPLPLPK